jgi:hypothetical protein
MEDLVSLVFAAEAGESSGPDSQLNRCLKISRKIARALFPLTLTFPEAVNKSVCTLFPSFRRKPESRILAVKNSLDPGFHRGDD